MRHNIGMDTDLQPIVSALADLTDNELHTLIASVNQAPQLVPGLLAWIEHAADWELRQRHGEEIPLQPPEAAIEPSEKSACLVAVMMLQKRFEPDAPAVAALFATIGGALMATVPRH